MKKFVIKHQDLGYLKGEFLLEITAFKNKFSKDIESAKLYDTAEDGESAKRRILIRSYRGENVKVDEVKLSIVPVEVSIKEL